MKTRTFVVTFFAASISPTAWKEVIDAHTADEAIRVACDSYGWNPADVTSVNLLV